MDAKPTIENLHDHILTEVNQAIDRLTLGNAEPIPRVAQPRYQKIIVAFDASAGANAALAWAKDLARSHHGEVMIASVIPPPSLATPTAMGFGWYPEYLDTFAQLRTGARGHAEEAARSLRDEGIQARTRILEGSVAREIATLASHEDADLVILGAPSTSRVERALLGSTATGLLGKAPCSVLIARGAPRPARILAAVDGSTVSSAAVAHALHRASATGAELVVLHVLDYPEEDVSDLPREGFLKAVEERLALPAPPPRIRYVLDAGHAATRILRRAEAEDAGLVVIGAYGKGAFERLVVGSTSRRVAAESHASVLVVKEP